MKITKREARVLMEVLKQAKELYDVCPDPLMDSTGETRMDIFDMLDQLEKKAAREWYKGERS